MIKMGRTVNVLLGHGDVAKFNLLGASFGNAGDVVLFGSGAQAHFVRPNRDVRLGAYTSLGGLRPPGSGAGCVHVDSWLPGDVRAGDIRAGDRILLINGEEGLVTYSATKLAPIFRVVMASGASLVCSDSAPIPVRRGGFRTPSELIGQELRARIDGEIAGWDVIADVQALGEGSVQHITAEDECFWAGETPFAYLPHHNVKNPNEGDDEGRTSAASARYR